MPRYFPKGSQSKRKRFKVPKLVKRQRPQMSSAIENLPNELLFRIIDSAITVNDRMCLAMTCRRFMQLSPCLKIKLPNTMPRIKDIAERRDMKSNWPFWSDIVHLNENFHPCKGCNKDRSSHAEDWAHVLNEHKDGNALRSLASHSIHQWCKKRIAVDALCPECQQTKSQQRQQQWGGWDDAEIVETEV